MEKVNEAARSVDVALEADVLVVGSGPGGLAAALAAARAGYGIMLWFFFLLSLVALFSAALLWRREMGPQGHGLEEADMGRRAVPAVQAG